MAKKGYLMIPASRNPYGKIVARRNIAAGFYDEDGQFHPIRASFDYSGKRGGDPPKKKTAKKRRKR